MDWKVGDNPRIWEIIESMGADAVGVKFSPGYNGTGPIYEIARAARAAGARCSLKNPDGTFTVMGNVNMDCVAHIVEIPITDPFGKFVKGLDLCRSLVSKGIME